MNNEDNRIVDLFFHMSKFNPLYPLYYDYVFNLELSKLDPQLAESVAIYKDMTHSNVTTYAFYKYTYQDLVQTRKFPIDLYLKSRNIICDFLGSLKLIQTTNGDCRSIVKEAINYKKESEEIWQQIFVIMEDLSYEKFITSALKISDLEKVFQHLMNYFDSTYMQEVIALCPMKVDAKSFKAVIVGIYKTLALALEVRKSQEVEQFTLKIIKTLQEVPDYILKIYYNFTGKLLQKLDYESTVYLYLDYKDKGSLSLLKLLPEKHLMKCTEYFVSALLDIQHVDIFTAAVARFVEVTKETQKYYLDNSLEFVQRDVTELYKTLESCNLEYIPLDEMLSTVSDIWEEVRKDVN